MTVSSTTDLGSPRAGFHTGHLKRVCPRLREDHNNGAIREFEPVVGARNHLCADGHRCSKCTKLYTFVALSLGNNLVPQLEILLTDFLIIGPATYGFRFYWRQLLLRCFRLLGLPRLPRLL